MGALRLVVGLGNPGEKYARTRHNVGFRLVEFLGGAQWKDFEGLGRFSRWDGVYLGEPMTYMNESGRFVQRFSAFHKIPLSGMLVCFDDVALPLGRLRLRPGGSSGGQRGMQSVIDSLGTPDVPRLRIGVGPQPPGVDSAAWVLGRFSPKEEEVLPKVIQRAADAVSAVASRGIEAAMNEFNGDEPLP